MDEQELNKKLAEWAGFKKLPAQAEAYSYIIIFPDGVHRNIGELPNFTQSLDACFKWLVPKLIHCNLIQRNYPAGRKNNSRAEVWKEGIQINMEAETPALALCLAISKLIDKEVTSEGNQNPNE